jgi:hypothetical protein
MEPHDGQNDTAADAMQGPTHKSMTKANSPMPTHDDAAIVE